MTKNILNKTLYPICILLLVSCGRTPEHKQVVNGESYETLLAKFKDKSFDTLEVYSSSDDQGKYEEYEGTTLDSNEIALFPEAIAERAPLNGIFAVYKFNIDEKNIGLIARTPAEYESSSIKLFFFDKTKKRIAPSYIELAENFGDAGYYMTKDAWLFKSKEQKLNALIWKQEGNDNSVENPEDTTTETWDYLYLFDVSGKKIDTLSTDSAALRARFPNLIK